MNPVLIGVAGPAAGSRFVFNDPQVTVGRVAENGIVLDDAAVSRRHCLFLRDGEEWLVRDLDSHNGTFVNGVPVGERPLADGDFVEIGDSTFTFRAHEGEARREQRRDTPSAATRVLPRLKVRVEPAALLQVTTMLSVLENLYRSRGGAAQPLLEQQLFELMNDAVTLDRVGILLTENGSAPELLCGWDRRSSPDAPVAVDEVVITEAIKTGHPVPASSPAGAVIAIPMIVADRVTGVLFVGANDPHRRFPDREVQSLTAIADIAALALHHACELEFLEADNRQLRQENSLEHSMIGESAPMRRLLGFISRVAQGNSTVLIRGESGTGKELVARAIHRNSARAARPFVAINCAALTETLLESEFFGHEKGSFTGATAQKKGKFEVAQGGTVFLDEIGELAPGLQAKLLRVLQEHEFERVGGTKTIPVDIRVIAATNRNLEEAIRAGLFRQDLYYRLNVVTLETPPLRQRKEDIPLLASWFAQRFAKATGRHLRGISDRARACLLAYAWPGNVRELENALERAVVLGSTDMILAEDLPDAIVEAELVQAGSGSYHDSVREAKKALIINALESTNWNVTEAARALELHPNYLHRLITQLNLRRRGVTI